jgi:hypothetical protein
MSRLTHRGRRGRRARRHRGREAILSVNAAILLARMLWRPLAADLLAHRPAPGDRSHVSRRLGVKRSARPRSHGVRGKLASLR